MNRREYLDWLRGIAVLIMIEAHAFDAWTAVAERVRGDYRWAIVVGGFGAPAFLFLAGISLALAAGARLRRGLSASDVGALARRRGWQIFGLAFLFRLQSWLISGGGFPRALLKVDILNIMGLAMVAGACVWGLGRNSRQRVWLLASAAVVATMITPLARATPFLTGLPAPFGWYFAPVPGWSTFTLLPWVGFLFAGGAVGVWLDAARDPGAERRVVTRLAVAGLAMSMGSYAASWLPPIYPETSFWTTSPAFFFVRLGLLVAALPAAYAWTQWRPGSSPIRELGASSFFVYWIHVELVYGVLTLPIHRRLTFEQAALAYCGFSLLMFGLVRLKNRTLPPGARRLRPIARSAPESPPDPVLVGYPTDRPAQ